MESFENKIFSVSEFIYLLNIGLKSSKAKIIGEVTEIKISSLGHVYFSLKDEKDGAVINCIIWKTRYNIYGIRLETGMKILASGYPEIYAPLGKLSFIAESIELAGEGELKKQYDELKKKLTDEGIFAEERKRPIPKYPQNIGVITSRQGAVLADFLNNVGKFGFKIKMIDSRVEGQEAVGDLLSSIRTFKNKNIDVLVIIRGGGSFESLMPFNNEVLVREVANFKVPVIAGVGHHKDEPLITFAADVSVSTPTAAANYLNQSWEEALLLLERYERSIIGSYEEIFENYKTIENKLRISLQNFKNAISSAKIDLNNYLDRSFAGFKSLLSALSERLVQSEKVIFLNNPERQLKLGYSIAMAGNRVVRKTGDIKIGQDLDLRVSDGKIISEIKKII
ncbi:MAG: exodeoxyribonuclease VII large subunit [Candidatus Nealsonbacteria bacterium]|nr:exodeoxyribonuclease VII large subunit [Candidatus Nealsonbacteria bacterium]